MTYAAPPTRLVRPMRGMTVTATVFLAAWGLLAIATIVVNVSGILTLGASGPSSDLDLVVFMALLCFFLQYPAIAVVGIVFVIWLSRAREKAESLSPFPHRRTRGWLVGGWLVPVVNLWFPKQIVDDLWRASDPRQDGRRPSIVLAWWVGFLATMIGLPIPISVLINTVDAGDAQATLAANVILTMDGLVAACLAIAIAWRIASMQEEPSQARARG